MQFNPWIKPRLGVGLNEMLDYNARSIAMAFEFHKHKKGDVVRVHCCDSCARAAGVRPKYPPDSGSKSWLCEVCQHYGIGSATDCTIGDWLTLKPNTSLTGGACAVRVEATVIRSPDFY